MAFPFGRFGASSLPALALALGILAAGLPEPAAAADINVVLDQARLVKLPDRVATIVIGNPLIADATVQAGGTMIITGKGFGSTNVIALDRSGVVLLEHSVEVSSPRGTVVVYRGVARETYSCTPYCEPRLTLGDHGPYFEANAAQIGARNALAQGTAPTK
jgi:hypothetical protein